MKNADMPAMPVDKGLRVALQDSYLDVNPFGITKREMFAMHAPDTPQWFIKRFASKNGLYNYSDTSIGFDNMMRVTKEWRYAYADMMLEEDV